MNESIILTVFPLPPLGIIAMTSAEPCRGHADDSLWWALGIAVVALLLRLALTNFPTDCHDDEPVIVHLTERAVRDGILTANWDGFSTESWSRPTYQFSPYTLVQSTIARLVHGCTGWPSSIEGYYLLARYSSCCWGALAVLLVFFLGRACFSVEAALWGEATLALCFLHVQDSIYARVDTFLCCLVLASLILAVRAARRPGRYSWFVATSLVAGVTLAAKYNAVPVLALIPWIALRWAQAGSISPVRAVIVTMASLVAVGIGFVIATPELVWQPGPFFTGLRFEIDHYTSGHISHQAHGWEDNNLFYWTRYLVWLGFGWLPSLFALGFVIRSVVLRRAEDLMLAAVLTISAVLVFSTRVRFERNLEICLGPMALAAGVMAWEVFRWLKNRRSATVAEFLCVSLVALWFFQPARVLYHFWETVDYPRQYVAGWLTPPFEPRGSLRICQCAFESPGSPGTERRQLILVDYGDPFSAEGLERWKQFLNREPVFELRSPWSKHGYPFSTVDVYHGPPLALGYLRLEMPVRSEPKTASPGSK